MACCSGGGYSTNRFKITVDSNFLCPICAEVLKEPVQCQNQHYFCKSCIKKHLEKNAKSCPICVQDLSEETLAQPPRILTDYLNGLLISCDHSERGCTEVLPVSRLQAHVPECNYRPIVCTNEKCGQTFNQEDLAEHVINACEYRLVRCPDCEDEMIYKKFSKHACVLSKDLNKLGLEWSEIKNVLGQVCNSQKEMCNSQKEECDSQREMYRSQKEMCNSQEEILNAVRDLVHVQRNIAISSNPQAPSPNVIASVMVIGGKNAEGNLSSVEVLYPGSQTWKVLQSMQESRGSAASVLYGNDVIVSGGRFIGGCSDTIERLSLVCKPLKWIPYFVKLPFNCCGHKVIVINNCLYLVGGCAGKTPFNIIYSILLHPPYTIEMKCEMPRPICFHGLQAFEELLFIFGGSTTNLCRQAVDSVLSYNTLYGEISVMEPLPFAICDVATVRWNDNVIIIGGTSTNTVSLNTVILYSVKENKHKMLPSMRHARSSCAATIAGNKVIVMGGYDWFEKKYLDSVECFDLDRQLWEELPPMNEARSEATAVVYAGLF
ncbi:E3 ubiquitin- ligase NRDP1 [Paramuricea clavata]|uniref:E3 ubiquitin- ligase NRDP1 n=1 Tax=Paramuricea clavata TaxID=317549 RepID=A0A6S7GGC6_PARCT|nr:E3 ubiquitin- ligase NRDP1 [Paramuricea clavata]